MTKIDGTKPPLIQREQMDGIVAAAGVETAAEIMDAFWRSTDHLMQSLNNALTAADFEEAGKVAHALKGSAANVGAEALSDAIRILEELCRDNDNTGVKTAFENINIVITQTRDAFSGFFENA